ncbi:MAG: hypothetical protein CFE21_08575 [Bacteroidetes bacterium B1(2017)]|nr:MAG: hypothetical protein CFE21_08575 [Bacteroidetes bacterium B1(2017)]
MKKLNLLLIAFVILAGTACKKDKTTDEPTASTPVTFTNCLMTKEVMGDGSYSDYTYNSNKQLTRFYRFTSGDNSKLDLLYTYSGNAVTITKSGESKPYQIYYLNSKGFADSLYSANFSGTTKYYFNYNSAGELIKKIISGEFTNSTILYEYTRGNITKETTIDKSSTSTITYDYYYDNVNHLAKTEQARIFTPSNKNLTKSLTIGTSLYGTYSYDFDSDNKPIKWTFTNTNSGIVIDDITWSCK